MDRAVDKAAELAQGAGLVLEVRPSKSSSPFAKTT
jgi:hypothetical protein